MFLVNAILLSWKNLFFILIGLMGIGFLIALHEFGHFLFCKLFKIRTPSFSIGFGPRLFTKKIGGTEFALSAIPLGGYVEIAGAVEVGQGEQKEAYRMDEYSFARKPYWQKFFVMMGGILFNLLFAYLAMILVSMSGLPSSPLAYPQNAQPIISAIAQDSAAEKANLEEGDTITAVNNTPIEGNVGTLTDLLAPHANQMVTLTIERDGKERTVEITLDEKQKLGKTVGALGVGFKFTATPGLPVLEAIKQGIAMTNARLIEIFQVVKQMFSKRDTRNIAGPLMIISLTMQGAAQGVKVLLILLAIISINLAALNLLPLPILDGGQLLFYTIEAIIGKPLPHKIREYIHIATWLMMLALFLYLSAQDLVRITSPYLEKIWALLGY
ncbi:MAG TPA: M50 family metallopeptidase [Candidatus Dependentiae bacterium]|nr:M50 family metallopeptidase [Candidatus Dependentiae bacterium]HRQ62292.1 M50 family metallopeptidase [Candidatus Dependentiae bacterium]